MFPTEFALSVPLCGLGKLLPQSLAARLIRLSFVVLIVASAIGADALVRSYTYYSQIVDARLASGYLTSRPGLYAAPRVLQTGQKLSPDKLISILRRAGYIESNAGNVWSGSFIVDGAAIEIRPG